MPTTHRVLAIATIATALAACTPTVPTPTPGATPAASLTSTATRAPSTAPTPLPTLGSTPNTACPTIPSLFFEHPFFAAVEPTPGRAHVELNVTAIEATWDPGTRTEPTPRPIEADDSGVLVGGREFTIWVESFYSLAAGPEQMISATATLVPEGLPASDLPVRIVPGNENFDQFAIAVPDIEGRARLDLELRWMDQCFRFTASASQQVTVVHLATAAACHLDEDHWFDDAKDLFDTGIDVGSSTQDLFSTSFGAKFVFEGTAGDPPVWPIEWKRHPGGVGATSGGWLEVADSVTSRDLKVVDATLYRRSDAVQFSEGDEHIAPPLWRHEPTPRADGSFRIPVAAEPGRYVLVIRFTFESACLTGSATSAFSLDVN